MIVEDTSGQVKDSAESMVKVFEAFEDTDKTNGKKPKRGFADRCRCPHAPERTERYFRNGLLRRRDDVRWITEHGKERLRRLRERRNGSDGDSPLSEE